MFAGAIIGGAWSVVSHVGAHFIAPSGDARGRNKVRPYICILLALLITLLGTCKRLQKVQEQRVSIGPFTILKATLRGHLAYTYHLCRHLTRYYTLPLLAVSLLIPPLLLLTCILCGTVIGVDYVRLGPDMGFAEYALCSLLDDCAYEVGVV